MTSLNDYGEIYSSIFYGSKQNIAALEQSLDITPTQINNLTDTYDCNAYEHDYDNEIELSQSDLTRNTSDKVSFGDVLTQAKELASVVQNDNIMRTSVFTTLSEWIHHLRHEGEVEVKFIKHPKNKNINDGQKIHNKPVPGVIRAQPMASNMKRKKSHAEIRKNVLNHSVNNNNMSQMRNKIHKGTRDCQLCRGSGHGKNECPCLNRFGKPLASKDSRSRQDLAMHLIDPTFYPNHYRTEGDKRIVFDNMPKIIPALVIHKRYIIDQNITNVTCASNLCCECTLLREGGNIEHGQH